MAPRLTVSAIIPAYCASETIGRAVRSVLSQTRAVTEILVVDDGSPDNLSAALEEYRDAVTLIRKPHGGAGCARNAGIEHARGDLIAFLDADDYWEPMKLERQVDIFLRFPEVALTATRFYEQIPGQQRGEPRLRRVVQWDQVLHVSGEAAFDLAACVSTPSVVVRREVLGTSCFDTSLETAQDRDLWVRIVSSHPVYMMSDFLTTVVMEPNSLSRSCIDRDCGNMLRVARRYSELLGPKGLRRWEAHIYQRWAGVLLSQGKPRRATGLAWSRMRRETFCLEAWWILMKSVFLGMLGALRGNQERAGEPNEQNTPPALRTRSSFDRP